MRWFADRLLRWRSPAFYVALAVFGLVAVFALRRTAQAAAYTNPFWSSTTSSPESAIDDYAAMGIVREGDGCRDTCQNVSVDVRTGELFWDFCLLDTPGKVEDNRIGLRWRSMISGVTQTGRQMLPSFEITVEKIIVDQQNPNGNGGHYALVRRPEGRIDRFNWNGSAYVAQNGDVFDALTTNASSLYVLTDKWGNKVTFDSLGMPNLLDDCGVRQHIPRLFQTLGVRDRESPSMAILRAMTVSGPRGTA